MSSTKVLVIDDDDLLLKSMGEVLGRQGFEVHLCADAEMGLEIAHTYHPDVILLDVLLPDSDGFLVRAKLRGSPDTRDIPVVIITGSMDEIDIRLAQARGTGAYLRKPMRSEELVRVVEERLESAQALRELRLGGNIPARQA